MPKNYILKTRKTLEFFKSQNIFYTEKPIFLYIALNQL